MQVCLFLTGRNAQAPLPDMRAMQDAATHISGLRRFIVHERLLDKQVDPRIAASAEAPACVLQFYFDELAALESACESNGPIIRALQTTPRNAPSQAVFTQQIMAVRTLMPPATTDNSTQRCTYLVAYEGPADDFNAWLTHYLREHPPLMLQLPALRELEIYTRLDAASGLPFPHEHAMQRNKVVFDNANDLAGALASPVRDAMRRDFHALPKYQGATPHFAMRSACVNLATR
jgi:uncharacterized protein (TIGR02118 family)